MHRPSVDVLISQHQVHYDPQLVDKPDELSARISGCDALIVGNRTKVDNTLLDQAGPQLKVVGRLGVGLERIDLDACAKREVTVIPALGCNSNTVAEYVIAATMMLLRGAYQCSDEVLAGTWPRIQYTGNEITGKTLGIFGFGAIGTRTAIKANALGMQVLACDPYVAASDPAWSKSGATRVSHDQLLSQSHALSLSVPLTEETYHLISRTELADMSKGSVLINSSRGGVVDEAALCAALESGHLAGAMLDVYENEPLTANSGLIGVENLILTPHIAGVTKESSQRTGEMIAQGVCNVLMGNS